MCAFVLALAAWSRLASWRAVFTAHGIELLPTDTHYYVRFALRLLHAFPRFDGFDPFVNAPGGATIIWPPLHAYAIAGAIALLGPERGPAWVDPFFALVELALVLWLARRRLGEVRALAVGLLLALVPAVVDVGVIGCADHHVHEPMIACALVLWLDAALEGEGRAWLWAGLLLGASRLFTTVTVVFIPAVGFAIALAGLLAPSEDDARRVGSAGARIALVAAAVLFVSALLFGEVRSLEYELVSGFLPLAALGVLGTAAGLAFLRARDRRVWWLLCALLLVAIVPSIATASRHLGRGDPLLASVDESLPLALDLRGAFNFFDVALLLLPLALFGAVRGLRQRRLAVALGLSLPLLAAAGFQARFARPCAGALAVLLACALPELLPRAAAARKVFAGVLVWLAVLLLRTPLRPVDTSETDDELIRPTLLWVRDHTPSAGDPWGDRAAVYSVVANFNFGHLLTLWGERPAVATPFSQLAWHVAGNERASAVLAATDDDEAWRAALATRAKYVIATPFNAILERPMADDRHTLARRMLDGAGMEDAFGPAYGHFRLLHDSAEQRQRKQGGVYARVFEVVPGAVLIGHAQPGSEVTAELTLEDRGQPLRYVRRTYAGQGGTFVLRVAYATGMNGDLRALGDYLVTAGGVTSHVRLSDEQIERGDAIQLPAEVAKVSDPP